MLIDAGGNCVSTAATNTFLATQANNANTVFVRASRVAKVWCEYDDPNQAAGTIGAGTMSAVHAKILLKLLQTQADSSTTYRDYVHSFFVNNVPYSPADEATLAYPWYPWEN